MSEDAVIVMISNPTYIPILLCFSGLGKKIDTLSKQRDCSDVSAWKQSINNHIYWCAATTPDGNGEVMQAKWEMLPRHIQNIHTHEDNPLFSECGHGELEGDSRDRLWLTPGDEYMHTRRLRDRPVTHMFSTIF